MFGPFDLNKLITFSSFVMKLKHIFQHKINSAYCMDVCYITLMKHRSN